MGSLKQFSRRIWLPDQISENVLQNKPCVVCQRGGNKKQQSIFWNDKQRWTCTPGNTHTHTHTHLSTPLWSFQTSRSCPFSFCYPTCVFLDAFSTISFISPLCYIWLLHRDEPAQLLNKSLLNKAGWKLGKRLFDDCLAINWLDGTTGGGKREKKKEREDGGKSRK